MILPGTELVSKQREFTFTDKDFNFIRQLVADRTGIVLNEGKRDMVYGRLSRRIRQLKLDSYKTYCQYLKDGNEDEMVEFTNAITTNLTSFFREPHHFEFLKSKLLPLLKNKKNGHRLRIWSAGCSSGEEPYSIAMVVKEIFQNMNNWDIKILATDLDSNMVNTSKCGIYTEERITGISKNRIRKFIRRGRKDNDGLVKISNELQAMITFKQLNLMQEWPITGPFDIIFCRNVVIYFDKDTQRKLFARFSNLMTAGGHLFIGHSESLHNVSTQFKLLRQTMYQRADI